MKRNQNPWPPAGESEMGKLIYAKDWSKTSLGAKEGWSQSFQSALKMCLASNSPISICWGDDLIFLYNDAWKDLIGDKHPSPLGQPARKVFENNWQTFNPCFKQVLTTGEVAEPINQLESLNDDEDRFLDLSFSPVPDESGSIGGIFIIAREAATHKNPEMESQGNKREVTNALLSAIVEGSDDAIVSKDLDSIITSWNDSAERIFGYTAEEAVGQPITLIFPEDRVDEENEIISQIRRGERIDHFETKRQRKDGTLIDVSLTISPIKDSGGNIIGASKIARDITKRKEYELNNAWLSAIVRSSEDAIISKDLNSIITSWNESAERIFGYTSEEAVGQPITMLFPDDRIDEEDEIIHRIKQGEHVDHFETKRIRKDGTQIDVSLTISPIKDSEGNIVGASKIARDITQRKEAEAKLEAMNQTLEKRVEERTKTLRSYQHQLQKLASKLNQAEENERQRLASELHDKLGQILTVAKMQVDGLQHQPLPDTISKDVEKLQQVVSDALSYNQNLMAELKPPPVLDKENVTDIVQWTVKKMEARGLDIILEDDGTKKPVESEIRSIFHQAVRELLQNVIKHADTNEARVSISLDNDRVKVTIEDKGKGFDLQKERLAPTEEGGLGLFNIQERVNWHGGSFEIYSEPGKGTKAILYAPLKEKQDISHQDKQSHHTPEKNQTKSEQSFTILLVDDHDMVRKGLCEMIEKQDDMSIVAEATNGREAVELALKYAPDIIVMDVNMPVMDGIEATKKIKSEMPNSRVIGLSLHDSREVIQDMINAGASSYLTKNEAFETLCETIRSDVAA